ncbi:MAG TPA: HDOD domain-containing protein [Steroidobacteraceae bacterium]|jgi:HD-like signal output (HDOD) protein|nr:HDOD domain-containing protein [Steroidobacteraceae bacterium]
MSNVAISSQATKAATAAAAGCLTSVDQRTAALKFLSDLAAEVSRGTVNLPSFPDVVVRIRRALADPDTKVTQIVKIVGAEPRLAARLMQAANSAAFNPAGKPLSDLRAAITRLGHRPVQSSAIAFAVRQLRLAPALRSIDKPLSVLWEESIAVASICQVVARRTKISPDQAFLTGLLHGIGRLYVMVRAAGKSDQLWRDPSFIDMVEGWHPAIGKAVLENWGFAEDMSQALGDQRDYDRGLKPEVDLTDVLIVSIELAGLLRTPGPRRVAMNGLGSFRRLGLHAKDCAAILQHTEHQLGALHAELGY